MFEGGNPAVALGVGEAVAGLASFGTPVGWVLVGGSLICLGYLGAQKFLSKGIDATSGASKLDTVAGAVPSGANLPPKDDKDDLKEKGVVVSDKQRTQKAAKQTAENAFNIAKAGGKHTGFYKNYLNKNPQEINKAINTLQTGKRGINIHLDKIANPSKYVPNWNTLRPGHQQRLIRGWQTEINNATEQIQILKSLLGR